MVSLAPLTLELNSDASICTVNVMKPRMTEILILDLKSPSTSLHSWIQSIQFPSCTTINSITGRELCWLYPTLTLTSDCLSTLDTCTVEYEDQSVPDAPGVVLCTLYNSSV